jgi:hypothetical protein
MFGHYLLVSVTLFGIFILFLVISRTMNNIINFFIKLEYLLQKEYDLKLEALQVRMLMDEQAKVHDEKNAKKKKQLN